MADEKLVGYIKSSLAKGYSLEDVRKSAWEQGWPQHEIDEAMLMASGSVPKPFRTGIETPGAKKKRKGHKKVIIGLIILFILILILLFTISGIINYFNNLYPEKLLP
jgi:hypothetical protein